MYVTTEKQGIINPDNYPRIDVYPDAEIYMLCAFTERSPDRNEPEHRVTIATYNDRVDADYALIHLYRSLDMGQNTWDPKKVPLLSDMWDEVKQKLSNDQHTSDFINNASLSITLPDKLTIKIPYTRPDDHSPYEKLDDKEKDRLTLEAEKVSTELIDSLKKDPVFPIRNVFWDCSGKK